MGVIEEVEHAATMPIQANEPAPAQLAVAKDPLIKVADPNFPGFIRLHVLNSVACRERANEATIRIKDVSVRIAVACGSRAYRQPLVLAQWLNLMEILLGIRKAQLAPVAASWKVDCILVGPIGTSLRETSAILFDPIVRL